MGIIYRPKGRAAEFSLLAANLYQGCSHGCKYCWVAKMPQWSDKDFFKTPPTVRNSVLEILRIDAPKYAGTDERVLLCFSCDPYQPLEIETEITRRAIEILREHDIPFQVLTKGGTLAARDFDLYGNYDAFAATLTFLHPRKSREYEPNAAIPRSRILSLEMAKSRGIQTWVSLEPVIDPKESLEIIRQTHHIVDIYKIGKLNYQQTQINWRKFAGEAIELCREYQTNYFIKTDLFQYLDGVPFYNTDTRKIKRQAPPNPIKTNPQKQPVAEPMLF